MSKAIWQLSTCYVQEASMRSNNVGCSIVAEIHQSNMARISSSAHASIALGAGEIVPDASYF